MMIHYYLFNNGSRAAHYGIGTYVGQLTEALRAVPDVRVITVDLNAEVREFTVTTDGPRHHPLRDAAQVTAGAGGQARVPQRGALAGAVR